jgi:hypothetical protein
MTSMPMPPPVCDPKIMDFEQLCDYVETLQRMLRFMNSEYEKLLDKLEHERAEKVYQFADPLPTLGVNDPLPEGQFLVIAPSFTLGTTLLWFYPPPAPVPAPPLPGPAAGYGQLGPGLVTSDGERVIVAAANLVVVPVRLVTPPPAAP